MFLFLAILKHVFDRRVKIVNELAVYLVSELHLCVYVYNKAMHENVIKINTLSKIV